MKSFWCDLGCNFLGGLRLAVFMRVRKEDFRASWTQMVALIGLGVIGTLAAEFVRVGVNGQFNPYSLPGVMFYVPLCLLAAWSMAVLARRPAETLTLATALLALAIPVGLVEPFYRSVFPSWFLGWMQRLGFYAYSLPQFWLAIAAGVAAIRIFALRPALSGPAVLIAAALLVLPQTMTWRGGLWTERYDEAEAKSRYMALGNEDTFYLQPKLLERELAGLKPGRKGTVDLYFVGVAGYASQDVFMREVNSISKLFRERFDTEGRSVRLINNSKSAADTPVASVTALKETLARLAQVMDPEEDILFLFLTSHGSREHKFSLEFWPIRFNTLDPETLGKLLRDSGIKRRVVVVSACYSGGFVEALRDQNSLVIAASAANRNSFGCSNDAEFTYFGKAYFDEALRETYSFIEAFEKAKPKIARREKEQSYEGSEPQIFVGKEIERPLAALEQRLSAGAARASDSPPRESTEAHDKYAAFVDIWVTPELIAVYRSECLRGMADGSPVYYLDKDPNYFGGLNRNSRHWPQLMEAWHAYSEEYCAAINNAKVFRDVYLDSYRRKLAEPDLDAAARFFRTEAGRRFARSMSEVGPELFRGLVERSRPSTDLATRTYMEKQVRINAAFQKERNPAAR